MTLTSFHAPTDDPAKIFDEDEVGIIPLSALTSSKDDDEDNENKKAGEIKNQDEDELEEVDELKALDRLEKELEREQISLNEIEEEDA